MSSKTEGKLIGGYKYSNLISRHTYIYTRRALNIPEELFKNLAKGLAGIRFSASLFLAAGYHHGNAPATPCNIHTSGGSYAFIRYSQAPRRCGGDLQARLAWALHLRPGPSLSLSRLLMEIFLGTRAIFFYFSFLRGFFNQSFFLQQRWETVVQRAYMVWFTGRLFRCLRWIRWLTISWLFYLSNKRNHPCISNRSNIYIRDPDQKLRSHNNYEARVESSCAVITISVGAKATDKCLILHSKELSREALATLVGCTRSSTAERGIAVAAKVEQAGVGQTCGTVTKLRPCIRVQVGGCYLATILSSRSSLLMLWRGPYITCCVLAHTGIYTYSEAREIARLVIDKNEGEI